MTLLDNSTLNLIRLLAYGNLEVYSLSPHWAKGKKRDDLSVSSCDVENRKKKYMHIKGMNIPHQWCNTYSLNKICHKLNVICFSGHFPIAAWCLQSIMQQQASSWSWYLSQSASNGTRNWSPSTSAQGRWGWKLEIVHRGLLSFLSK